MSLKITTKQPKLEVLFFLKIEACQIVGFDHAELQHS